MRIEEILTRKLDQFIRHAKFPSKNFTGMPSYLRAGNLILKRRPYTSPPPILRSSELGKISARLCERDFIRCTPKLLGIVVVLPIVLPATHWADLVPSPRWESQHRATWARMPLSRRRINSDVPKGTHALPSYSPGCFAQ